MTLPNFIIIGAAKAGTTSLYSYLKQHPQIYMSPEKEPRFFAPEFYSLYNKGLRNTARTSAFSLKEYLRLFEGVSDEVAIGEASPEYLYIPGSAERIKDKMHDVKLIAVLRNPVDRAFSAFLYQVRDGYEHLNFEQALQMEEQRIKDGYRPGWHYKQVGFYCSQIKQYLDIFDPHQMRIYLYDELSANSNAILRDVFHFLCVDDLFEPDLTKENVSGIPRNKIIHSLLTRDNISKSILKRLLPKKWRKNVNKIIRSYNMGTKPILNLETRQILIDIYRQDIIDLQKLIQRDLSHWLN